MTVFEGYGLGPVEFNCPNWVVTRSTILGRVPLLLSFPPPSAGGGIWHSTMQERLGSKAPSAPVCSPV